MSRIDISSTAYMEQAKWQDVDKYDIKGSGDLSNCKDKLCTYSPKKINILFDGNFDKIEDDCFSRDNIRFVKPSSKAVGFKHLGDSCFRSPMLEILELPETLETIGHNNFSGTFTSFNIPSKIKDFPADNLIDCNKLTTITVSEGNTAYKVVDGILYNYDLSIAVFCPNAKTGHIILPNTVKHIGDYCFYGCKDLKGIYIPSSVESIGDYAFSQAKFDKLVIPNSVKSIGNGCFLSISIKDTLRLSSQINIIPKDTFLYSDIKNLIFSFRNVIKLGEDAIAGYCPIKNIPKTVSFELLKHIDKKALSGCNNVHTFELFSSLENISDEAFDGRRDNVVLRYYSYCPIRLSTKAFQGLSDRATLIVPKGTRAIYENCIPWSTIQNIEECELDIDIDSNGNETSVSDDVHYTRLKSVIQSKAKADKYLLKDILEMLSLNYQYVDSDEEYQQVLNILKYNHSFSPAIIPELGMRISQNWENKYKLKLANELTFNGSGFLLSAPQEDSDHTLPLVDAIAIPAYDATSMLVENPTNIRVFFNEDILKQLQNSLTETKHCLKIAVSWFTNYSIFKQIKELAESGIKIQLIINNDLINNGGYCLNMDELIKAGVEVSLIEYPHLLHHKFCIIDNTTVITGSYNWTRFSAKNYENITIIQNNEEIIEQFNNEFNHLLTSAEHKCVDRMPEFVSERPEYDRSAFKQYVTEELDAQACETNDERNKITALKKAASINLEYLEMINPQAKQRYTEAFKAVDEAHAMQQNIINIIEGRPIQSQTTSHNPNSSSTQSNSNTTIQPHKASNPTPAQVINREDQSKIDKVKASNLVMVLDVSGSMSDTYNAGHVHKIAKKALSASLAITDSQEVSIWTFGDNALFYDNVGIDTISKIDQIKCKNQGTDLSKFTSTADSSIADDALVIILTDDDANSISAAIPMMQKRPNVFWQIIVYDSSYSNISNTISNASNTSAVSLYNYAHRTDEEISSLLLRDYINWKNK